MHISVYHFVVYEMLYIAFNRSGKGPTYQVMFDIIWCKWMQVDIEMLNTKKKFQLVKNLCMNFYKNSLFVVSKQQMTGILALFLNSINFEILEVYHWLVTIGYSLLIWNNILLCYWLILVHLLLVMSISHTFYKCVIYKCVYNKIVVNGSASFSYTELLYIIVVQHKQWRLEITVNGIISFYYKEMLYISCYRPVNVIEGNVINSS